jgi:bifunctional non-homologous end joining protein LigD
MVKNTTAKKTSKMPASVSPMLCTLVKETPQLPDYIYEMKWDGYRIIAYSQGKRIRLDSRSGLDYTAKYPPVKQALQALGHDVIIDGEVVVFNDEGKPDFDALQKYNGHETPIRYCVFDLLWLDGQNLMEMPLSERKTLLQMLIKGNNVLQYSESYDDGAALYDQVLQDNLEGIVAKRRDSIYQQGARNNDWLKVPTKKRQEFVIGGWAESERGRSFRSLLFGAYEKGKLTWIGRSGGGYKEKEMPGILKKLKALEIDSSPFANKVLDTKGAVMHWVKPQLVANFEFATWTKSGRIRKPATFLGFRLDKKAKQVVREVPETAKAIEQEIDEEAINDKPKGKPKKHQKYLNEGSNWKRVDESILGKRSSQFPMEHCSIDLHDVERELWKGITKADMILYYNTIAKYILPHLLDRPQSLNLKLTHAGGPTTFIKDMEGRQPECADVFTDERRVKKKGKRSQIDYLVCNNVETLLSMIDWGCVDVNPWTSRIQQPEHPDYIWIDLDPTVPSKKNSSAEDKGFQKAVEVALASQEILKKHKLKSFIKTSGKTGLHIYIPCDGFNFTQGRLIANHIADEIYPLVASVATREESISHRADSVYIDANQNDYADTLAAPYCIRPYHQPLVSTPLDWKEIKNSLDRYSFTMHNIHQRLEKKGDIFIGAIDGKAARTNSSRLKVFL